jgi:hypothetical protein
VLIWLLILAAGLAVGVVFGGLGAHPKADGAQIVGGVLVIATVTVFALALLRFLFKNLRGAA